ncbi:MAG: outer membrane beta-barrel family protein, partial [Paramuribaculum sp.]|nr:outer membrane beta-barrel family protein [Paramuribaculum sp.]
NNIVVRYEMPGRFSVGGDYSAYNEEREQTLTKSDAMVINAVNSQTIRQYHVYIDKEHQLGKWQLNYGVEYSHSTDHSRQKYIMPENDGFNNILKEDVADAYVGTQASLDCGLSFSASVKAEYFHNDYRHTWNFVPQLGATYYRTPKSIFQLNFTSQRIYPQYWELHGGTSYINDYSTVQGNPELQPYMNYSGQFSYIFRQKYVATLYLLYADKYSVQLPYQKPDELKLLFQTTNLDFSRTIGVQFNVPFSLRNVWNATTVANIMNNRAKSSRFHDIGFDNRRFSFYGSLNNTIKFTPDCPLSLSIDFAYITGQIQGLGRFNSFWKMDAGAKLLFGKKRCCELDLKFTDIFNTWNPELTIITSGQDYRMIVHDMTRNMNLTFVWRFNGFKPKQNSVDTSRFGTGN